MSDIFSSSKRRGLVGIAVAYEEAVIHIIPVHIAGIENSLILRRACKDSNTEPRMLTTKRLCIIVYSS